MNGRDVCHTLRISGCPAPPPERGNLEENGALPYWLPAPKRPAQPPTCAGSSGPTCVWGVTEVTDGRRGSEAAWLPHSLTWGNTAKALTPSKRRRHCSEGPRPPVPRALRHAPLSQCRGLSFRATTLAHRGKEEATCVGRLTPPSTHRCLPPPLTPSSRCLFSSSGDRWGLWVRCCLTAFGHFSTRRFPPRRLDLPCSPKPWPCRKSSRAISHPGMGPFLPPSCCPVPSLSAQPEKSHLLSKP